MTAKDIVDEPETEAPLSARILAREDLQAYLDSEGPVVEIMDLPVATPTVPSAAESPDVPPSRIAKSIVFAINPKGAVLAIAPGQARIDIGALAKLVNVAEGGSGWQAPTRRSQSAAIRSGRFLPSGTATPCRSVWTDP